jgi:ATP/maltotriose-dependent transcriptional regulator MalT
MPSSSSPDLAAGQDALARGAWVEARDAFESCLRHTEAPEALEGLGLAAWWLDLADVVFDVRERAYRLYLAADARAAAARVAVWLAWDYWAFRGEHAVASGWFQRARRLLEGESSGAERAWLEVREGAFCLLEEGDIERAHALAGEGMRAARQAGNVDLEMLGRAVQGLALVASGAVAEGMRGLDEVNAAVVAGELTDLVSIGLSCCYMLAACERVRDYDRAVQWCTRLKAFSAKWGLRPLFAVCRTQYASICLWRGTWDEAEQELNAASQELAASRPAMTGEALVRLAELRRRQGRLVDAAALLDQAGTQGLALLGRAELAFDRGDLRAAEELASRYLRHVPTQNRTERASGLDLLVRALTGLGEWDRAKTALAELSGIATVVATIPLRAAASLAQGYVAVGEARHDEARRHLEDAVDLFLQSGAPFEVARARVELASALAGLGRIDDATEEIHRAVNLLSELRAEHEIARARRVLESFPAPSQSERATAPDRHSGLTKRELEVLRLVAGGLSNQTIAERLFVSDHTVHRHLANILSKLSVSTRAAAVAQAARRGLLS